MRDDLLYANYGQFAAPALRAVRAETYGEDLGQNSWITADEFARFVQWLALSPAQHVLEVACGSGGPALFLADRSGCRVTGIDADARAVETARALAGASSAASRMRFQVADADARLPFEDSTFDALVCIDALNHLLHRRTVFAEWRRVLRPGARAVFTDPVVITGPVTNDELARRSSIGSFLFVPPGVNERLLAECGLHLVRQEDATANIELVSARWHDARARHEAELLSIEGVERFRGQQAFLDAVHTLTAERRLSRIAYFVERPAT